MSSNTALLTCHACLVDLPCFFYSLPVPECTCTMAWNVGSMWYTGMRQCFRAPATVKCLQWSCACNMQKQQSRACNRHMQAPASFTHCRTQTFVFAGGNNMAAYVDPGCIVPDYCARPPDGRNKTRACSRGGCHEKSKVNMLTSTHAIHTQWMCFQIMLHMSAVTRLRACMLETYASQHVWCMLSRMLLRVSMLEMYASQRLLWFFLYGCLAMFSCTSMNLSSWRTWAVYELELLMNLRWTWAWAWASD